MFEKIKELAKKAGEIMLCASNIEKGTKEKSSSADIVTEYDLKVQSFLIENLSKLCPEAYFLGEEGGSGNDSRVLTGKAFIIDPIDGTTNFVRGFKKSAVSIAYIENGETVFGCVYNPYADELVYAEKGKGAYLNGKKVECAGRDIDHAVVTFGTSPYYKEYSKISFEIMSRLFERAMDLRRFASAVIDITDVALGRSDLYFEMRLFPWDFAAASLIAKEANCKVSRMNGESMNIAKQSSILVASPKCYEYFMSLDEVMQHKDLF